MRRILFALALLAVLTYATENLTVKVDIPASFAKVGPGDTLWSTTTIFNMGGSKRVDITLRYDILDDNKKLIETKTKTIAIETQVSTSEGIKIKEGAKPGDYTLRVTVYGVLTPDSTFAGEHGFQIIKQTSKDVPADYSFAIYGAILLILIAVPIIGMPYFKKYKEKSELKGRIRSIVQSRIK